MRIIFYLVAAALTLLVRDCATNNNDQREQEGSVTVTGSKTKVSQQYDSFDPRNVFSLSDAEKILGEPAYLKDSTSTFDKDTSTFKCAYTANSKDQKTGKTGAVYFLFEKYTLVSAAQNKYSFIKKANEDHEGVRVLHDMGDEAYFHTDGENFYFIMVRKGEKIFNMKVNKITSTTSLEEFNLIAKKITDAL